MGIKNTKLSYASASATETLSQECVITREYMLSPNFKTVNSGKRWKTLHSDVFSRGSLNTFASIFPGFHSSTRGGFRDPPF